MKRSVETVIIGAGQAGLATSYHLMQRGIDHLVLEKGTHPGHVWRSDRWDSFTLVSPNWSVRMPGAEYAGDAPDGYMTRAEIVSYFEHYVERFRLPVQYHTQVTSVEQRNGRGYAVRDGETSLEARTVVMATGLFQQHRIPSWSNDLSREILQLHTGQYRTPSMLPPGAVLVAGSGQSGCQIAQELYESGRTVYLSIGSAGRVPRRYRGKDIFEWLVRTGFLERTPDMLPSSKARFSPMPHLSGRDGGRTLNLHEFTRSGVVLLGHLTGGEDLTLTFAPDRKETMAKVDRFEADIVAMVDAFVEKQGLDAPREDLPQRRDGYAGEEIALLNMKSAGITSIIWAMGYQFDFSLVKLPVFDSDGYPLQQRGITSSPGLYFVGLPWLHRQKSGLLIGVGEDAEYIASSIAGTKGFS